MKKFERLIALIYLLKKGSLHSKEIAAHLGIAERTVYRDINDLNDALDGHVRILADENGYSLDETLYAPPLHFISEEIDALQTAVAAMDSNNPHFQLAHQALSKIQTQSGARPSFIKLEQHLEVMQPLAKDRTPVKRLQELEYLLRKKKILEIDYFSHNSGKNKIIRFAPYALLFRKNAWYLLGQHLEKNKIILLRAYRIHNIKPTEQNFDLPNEFSASNYFKTSWEVFDGQVQKIHLRFKDQSAWRIQEMTWHPSQELNQQENNVVDLHLNTSVNPEFISWILGWGAECEVIAPESLKIKIKEAAQQLYSVYQLPRQQCR